MRNKIMILLTAVLCLSLLCCGCATDANDKADVDKEEAAVETQKEDTEDTDMSRINIFETGIMELATQDVDSNGTAVAAYAVKDYVDEVFAADPAGSVALVASDGYSASTDVDEFLKNYITLEGESAPLFVGPDLSGELSVKFLQYIKTANESICFVADSLEVSDIFSDLGMVEADNYKFVASDDFSAEVAADDIAECTLKKDGESVNATIPGLKGDMRDILYIEAIK